MKTMPVNDRSSQQPRPITDRWPVRLVKGILIGIGFILPGFSGGVMAVILGIYDRLLRFLANLRNRFLENLRYLMPVFIGLGIGIWLFALVVDEALTGRFKGFFTCLFIGFVLGTLPSLWRNAGQQGRGASGWIALTAAAVAVFLLMILGDTSTMDVQPSFLVWLAAGASIGLGVIVPGLSPSNFLLYLGLYEKMTDRIKAFDLGAIVPLALGAALCVLILAKVVSWMFCRHYQVMHHIIVGTVIGSSLALFPTLVFPSFSGESLNATGFSLTTALIIALILAGLGAAASFAFSKLEDRHPREDLEIG